MKVIDLTHVIEPWRGLRKHRGEHFEQYDRAAGF